MDQKIFAESIRGTREYAALGDALIRIRTEKPYPIMVTGLCEGATYAFCRAAAADLRRETGGPTLLITAQEKEAVKMAQDLRDAGLRASFYPVRDLRFYNMTASHEIECERLFVLNALAAGTLDCVVTTPDAALEYTVPRATLAGMTRRFDESTRIDTAELSRFLLASGYTACEGVQGPGQFSVRGGIVDIFPLSGTVDGVSDSEKLTPIRMELFGDEIDRMTSFDWETQRSTDRVTAFSVSPARELIASAEAKEKIAKEIDALLRKNPETEARHELEKERASLISGVDLSFLDKYVSLIYPEKECLLDHLTGGGWIVCDETAVANRLSGFNGDTALMAEAMIEAGTLRAHLAEYVAPASLLDTQSAKRPAILVDPYTVGARKKLTAILNFRTRPTMRPMADAASFFEDVKTGNETGTLQLILCEKEAEVRLLLARFAELHIPAAEAEKCEKRIPGTVYVTVGSFPEGYELIGGRFAVTVWSGADPTLARKRANRIVKHKREPGTEIFSYADLNVGDYVVHENYGVGQYTGIENIGVAGVYRDYVVIRYAGTDRLMLPVEQLDAISRYVGAHGPDGEVKLSKMGGGDWRATKAKAKAATKEMAKELLSLYAVRAQSEGFPFLPDDELIREFDGAFEYELTDSQRQAVEEIKADMEKAVPMDRLLCGDVGYGKTEVAMRAAFKAIMSQKQVAMLVPTTILAMQHYQTALSRFAGYPVNIEMLSRFRTPTQKKKILDRTRRGDVDLLIGTHAMLTKELSFRDLGLLIVDEEQRFGVAQKEKLKKLTPGVDILTMTATPIPRTLNMTMENIRDMSVLDEAPGDRVPVQSYVLEYDKNVIAEAIRRELRRGGQVFYLHNRTDSIYRVAKELSETFPDASVAVAHGKMPREEIEEIWQSLVRGEIDVLVSTTIIETGIDVPNANTLIIEDADRMGLSQLHQIRGRVGRSSRRAYAYFTYPGAKEISEISRKRLDAIRDFTEFGAGFKIAMRDMEIRGAGELLGASQHGHMESVGYELYIKLLREAIMEEQGRIPERREECTVSAEMNAYLSEKYIAAPMQRMDMYRKIARLETAEDERDLRDEMLDRFGALPREAENLLKIARVRAAGAKAGIKKIDLSETEARLYPDTLDFEAYARVCALYPNRVKLFGTAPPTLTVRLQKGEGASVVAEVLDAYNNRKTTGEKA